MKERILGIDPGKINTGWAVVDAGRPKGSGNLTQSELQRWHLQSMEKSSVDQKISNWAKEKLSDVDILAVEASSNKINLVLINQQMETKLPTVGIFFVSYKIIREAHSLNIPILLINAQTVYHFLVPPKPAPDVELGDLNRRLKKALQERFPGLRKKRFGRHQVSAMGVGIFSSDFLASLSRLSPK